MQNQIHLTQQQPSEKTCAQVELGMEVQDMQKDLSSLPRE